MIARSYIMQAVTGKGGELETALRGLAKSVRALPDSLGVEILQDPTDSDRFLFIEKWLSQEAHKAAGALLAKAVVQPVIGLLGKPLDGAYWNYLEVI